MPTWTYKRASVTAEDASVLASKPLLLFRQNGPVVFTKNYVKHRLLSKKTYPQGTEGMITKIHTGPLGGVTHVDVRLSDGEFVCEVPVNNFLLTVAEHSSLVLHLAACNAGSDWSHDIVAICTET
jgi:hypothetical protein